MKLPVEYLIPKYQDRLYGAAFSVLQNSADARDAVQLAFIQYHQNELSFENEDHIRAWLFRTVVCRAKDINRSFWRRHRVDIDAFAQTLGFETPREQSLFASVAKLAPDYRMVLQLYYYEEYSVKEIAAILGIRENTVKKRLERARRKLKEELLEEWRDEERQSEILPKDLLAPAPARSGAYGGHRNE